MTVASFRQMTNDKVIRRADAEKIQYKDLHVEPGFNPIGRMEDDEDGGSLFQFIMSGGRVPDLETRPREEGGVWIVDGHRRHYQIGRAIEAGAPLQDKDGAIWISIKQFIGNDIDRVCRIATSNEGKKLTAIQLAEVYKRLAGFGLSVDDIAKRMTRTRQHVEQIMVLANANHDVQAAVRRGEISPSLAISATRANGEGAGAVIAAEVQKAHAAGKKRVTASTMKPWAPPMKFSAPIVTNARRLIDSMPLDVVAKASNANAMNDADKLVTVTISTKALFLLVQTVGAVDELRAEAEEKKAAKAAKVAA
jgi:ParB family chromosome partitioning protein